MRNESFCNNTFWFTDKLYISIANIRYKMNHPSLCTAPSIVESFSYFLYNEEECNKEQMKKMIGKNYLPIRFVSSFRKDIIPEFNSFDLDRMIDEIKDEESLKLFISNIKKISKQQESDRVDCLCHRIKI